MRAIDGDALMSSIEPIIEAEEQIYGRASWRFATKCRSAIEDAPTIEPERKTGKWEKREVSRVKAIDEWQSARCSVCGLYHTTPYLYYFKNYNYCPNCGADMRGEG